MRKKCLLICLALHRYQNQYHMHHQCHHGHYLPVHYWEFLDNYPSEKKVVRSIKFFRLNFISMQVEINTALHFSPSHSNLSSGQPSISESGPQIVPSPAHPVKHCGLKIINSFSESWIYQRIE